MTESTVNWHILMIVGPPTNWPHGRVCSRHKKRTPDTMCWWTLLLNHMSACKVRHTWTHCTFTYQSMNDVKKIKCSHRYQFQTYETCQSLKLVKTGKQKNPFTFASFIIHTAKFVLRLQKNSWYKSWSNHVYGATKSQGQITHAVSKQPAIWFHNHMKCLTLNKALSGDVINGSIFPLSIFTSILFYQLKEHLNSSDSSLYTFLIHLWSNHLLTDHMGEEKCNNFYITFPCLLKSTITQETQINILEDLSLADHQLQWFISGCEGLLEILHLQSLPASP